jgi:ABC-type glutathione transport system ATPase component
VLVDPALWENVTEAGRATLAAAQNPNLDPEWPVSVTIPGWTDLHDGADHRLQGSGRGLIRRQRGPLPRLSRRGNGLRRNATGRTAMTDEPDLLLDARGVAKSFGAVRALTDASLTVARGEVVALMGANGAGKSTFVKILTGRSGPTAAM